MALAKHLKNRSETIRTAINAVNAAGRALFPPRAKVEFGTVIAYAFLGEFDLLRDARQDVREKPWANPDTRIFTDQYFKLLRAKEEIQRLNIEMRRLRSWIRDDIIEQRAVHTQLVEDGKAHLASELWSRFHSRERINSHILRFLDEVESWEGFSGISGCGVKQGGTAPSEQRVRARPEAAGEGGTGEESDDEAVNAEVDRVEAVLERMIV